MSVVVLSREWWDANPVAELPLDVTADASLAALEQRNAMYLGLEDLMPTDVGGVSVLDFGCGPGHDTIAFLLNGAEHVYAVDQAWHALEITRARVIAHGVADRCTLMLVGEGDWYPPPVDYVHTAGVIHHCADPVSTLRKLRKAIPAGAEIRMMVYSAESYYYRVLCGGDPARFRPDGAAPIQNAWTVAQVHVMAKLAMLDATHVGSYTHPGEVEGPGLSACYSLKKWPGRR